MSSQAVSTLSGSRQQTLHEAVHRHRIHEPVRGVCPRLDLPDESTEEWIETNHYLDTVVINFSKAVDLVERDGNFETVLEPWHLPVILGTEEDEVVHYRTLHDILSLLECAQPAIYVPDAVYNYTGMSTAVQTDAIQAYLDHVAALQELIIDHGLDIRVLPTNKGWTVEHFEQYHTLYDRFDYQDLAFYAVQYTGGDAGNASRKLRRHITHAISALELRNVFVIGRLARQDLLRFDPTVGGAAGLRQWQAACATDQGYSQAAWHRFKSRREAALRANNGQEQQYLDAFIDNTEACS